MFDSEFYRMADQLGRELDELAQARPSLLPGRNLSARLAMGASLILEAFGQMSMAASHAIQGITQAFAPAVERFQTLIINIHRRHEEMQRLQLELTIRSRLISWRLAPDWLLDVNGPIWWLCQRWPRRWLPRLDADEWISRHGR